MKNAWMPLACAGLLLVAGNAAAQLATTYKCPGEKGQMVYSQVPCKDGKKMEKKEAAKTDVRAPVSQDRAVAANRARLTPEARKECDALAASIRTEEAAVKAKGAAATPVDEKNIVDAKMKRREMKCA